MRETQVCLGFLEAKFQGGFLKIQVVRNPEIVLRYGAPFLQL